jgi:hypothetical protein
MILGASADFTIGFHQSQQIVELLGLPDEIPDMAWIAVTYKP